MQTLPELSPGVQIGGWAAGQVTLHFGHGGGPSTLQLEGLVISQAGVAVGAGVAPFEVADSALVWAFALGFSPPTAAMGKITHAINKIVTAIILFFIDYFLSLSIVVTARAHQTLLKTAMISRWKETAQDPHRDSASITTNDRYPIIPHRATKVTGIRKANRR